MLHYIKHERLGKDKPGNTKGGNINVQLTSSLTGLDLSVLIIKTKIVSCHTADSNPAKQEVNDTVILPPPFSIPWENTLAYLAHSSVTKKMKCCE